LGPLPAFEREVGTKNRGTQEELGNDRLKETPPSQRKEGERRRRKKSRNPGENRAETGGWQEPGALEVRKRGSEGVVPGECWIRGTNFVAGGFNAGKTRKEDRGSWPPTDTSKKEGEREYNP